MNKVIVVVVSGMKKNPFKTLILIQIHTYFRYVFTLVVLFIFINKDF